jgi:thioredoxin reductase
MQSLSLVLVLLSLSLYTLANQIPLTLHHDGSSDSYRFDSQVRKVAIIGAGPGGMIAYRELTQAGFESRLFERDDMPGGNWHYTNEIPLDAPVPNADPSVADYMPSLPPEGINLPFTIEYRDGGCQERKRSHRAPKAIYDSLTTNAPSPWQQIMELPWPAGTNLELPHSKVASYLRAFASFHSINTNDGNKNVSYNTRVELVEKKSTGWTVTLKKFEKTGDHSCRATWWTENFDAVVVATGTFNAPNIPPITGLAEWVDKFPERIIHSRQYRRAEPYKNQTVLIVGAAISGGDISRELNQHVRKVYQSIRPDNASVPHVWLDKYLARIPTNTTFVPEIKRFHPPSPGATFSEGRIELFNGTIITGIDRIIFATGFRYSYPFLRQYHNSTIASEIAPDVDVQPIVTDGTHLRSLYLDLFYIGDPTLGFINVNMGIHTFIYPEYLALALAKVWGGKAKLPSKASMWQQHHDRVSQQGGYNRHFQFVGFASEFDRSVEYFVGWLNAAAVKYGGRQIDGLPKRSREIGPLWVAYRFGANIFDTRPSNSSSNIDDVWAEVQHRRVAGSPNVVGLPDRAQLDKTYEAVFNGYW